jgi:hypothetical protein
MIDRIHKIRFMLLSRQKPGGPISGRAEEGDHGQDAHGTSQMGRGMTEAPRMVAQASRLPSLSCLRMKMQSRPGGTAVQRKGRGEGFDGMDTIDKIRFILLSGQKRAGGLVVEERRASWTGCHGHFSDGPGDAGGAGGTHAVRRRRAADGARRRRLRGLGGRRMEGAR